MCGFAHVVVCNAGAHYVSDYVLGVTHPICFCPRILRLVSLGSSRVITPSAGVGEEGPTTEPGQQYSHKVVRQQSWWWQAGAGRALPRRASLVAQW